MSGYLGKRASEMLQSEPFKHWPVKRSIEDDLEKQLVEYVFTKNGLELLCDSDDTIRSIFLYPQECSGFDESLSGLPFSLKREQVLDRLGSPSKSGNGINDPVLGKYGAWDRFTFPDWTIHIEYKVDVDAINRITLMRNDVVP